MVQSAVNFNPILSVFSPETDGLLQGVASGSSGSTSARETEKQKQVIFKADMWITQFQQGSSN